MIRIYGLFGLYHSQDIIKKRVGNLSSERMETNLHINLVIVLVDISSFVMSGGILCKILVLGTSEMA
jgi:hypothetical protein